MYYMDQEMIKVAGSEEGDSRKIKKYVCVCVCRVLVVGVMMGNKNQMG